jgi:hypothetical protein
MKINQIISEMTAGCVATVAMPMGGTRKRTNETDKNTPAVQPSKLKKKGPYANSLTEGAMKQLSMDLKELKDEEFKKKYGKTKQEARKALTAKPESVNEADLQEDDIIVVPGQGRKAKSGFIPHGQSRVDHEVEMARSDLFSAAKNAKQVYEMIQSVSEDEGLEGWVQEKIIKANDYLNTIREYLEGKQIQQETSSLAYEGKIDFAKKIQKNIDKSNKAVVKTNKEVGSRVADIGAGGKEYNVKTDKAWDDAQKAKKAK